MSVRDKIIADARRRAEELAKAADASEAAGDVAEAYRQRRLAAEPDEFVKRQTEQKR